MIHKIIFIGVLFLTFSMTAQKKVLEHDDFEIWNAIKGKALSPNGDYVIYALQKGEKDSHLKIKDSSGKLIFEHERSEKGLFTYDSKYALFTIKAWKDSVTAMKSRKVKKEKLPKDSLGILNISTGNLDRLANIKSYKVPEKWSGFVAYLLEEVEKDSDKDSTEVEDDKKDKPKKVGKKTGHHLVLRNLTSKKEDTIKFVTNYIFAKRGHWLAYSTTGEDKKSDHGVFVMNLENGQTKNVHRSKKAKYHKLGLSETGKKLGFVVDTDTTKIQVRPNELYVWEAGTESVQKLLEPNAAPEGYIVSSNGKVHFSKDESKLFFGLAKQPIPKDTTLTEDEIVNVEVWTYDEPRLYTVQELQLKKDTVQSFETVVNLNNNKLVQLGNASYTDTELVDEGNALYALSKTSIPHELESQWTGRLDFDYQVTNTNTGEVKLKLTKVPSMKLSPKAKYTFGYNDIDSTWFTYATESGNYKALTKGKPFYDELNDSPKYPNPYGSAGWTENDKHLILYDRYDIWRFDPVTGEGIKLTSGKKNKTVYRYIALDKEIKHLSTKEKWLLTTFNETSKDSGYALFNPRNNELQSVVSGPYHYSIPLKAELDDVLLYTRESFQEFPDLRLSNLDFKSIIEISDANPQQKEYNWGAIELVNWNSLDGKKLTGMLVKPENFDPNKKYPLLVNFYEKSSDRLHRYWQPRAERSTINYSYYTSRGYVIFNPDVHYRIGYPGESAFNCVIPGVTSLIEKGFIDEDNIGVQGHSWGGYQIAYLVTRTDIFKAAEAGAPVPNMISAYGGIRWWTGLSRQFQYEHTQSRIGGTPWQYPTRYIENSPIFSLDKINTPLLIMHNDADGHVPWYQGIELFVGLRRLGKPSWFLNYNGEPHWPLKLQNRKDFSLRMSQYFDYYLKSAPKPLWMERGVPAIEKGIDQGLEFVKDP